MVCFFGMSLKNGLLLDNACKVFRTYAEATADVGTDGTSGLTSGFLYPVLNVDLIVVGALTFTGLI